MERQTEMHTQKAPLLVLPPSCACPAPQDQYLPRLGVVVSAVAVTRSDLVLPKVDGHVSALQL